MALGDPRGAALPAIYHQKTAIEPCQVQRRGQPGGTAADDQAIQRVILALGHPLLPALLGRSMLTQAGTGRCVQTGGRCAIPP